MEAAFDTHQFVKSLTANGFTEKQAEVLANERVVLLNSNLATKADIQSVNKRIEALRCAPFGHREVHRGTPLGHRGAHRELNADLQRWTITVVLTVAGFMAAVALVVTLVSLL